MVVPITVQELLIRCLSGGLLKKILLSGGQLQQIRQEIKGFKLVQKLLLWFPSREETIISTDEAIYGMTFVGPPFIFSFRLLATNAGAAGINTMINIDGNVYWMGRNNFFTYDGVVKEIPCSVQYFVFDRLQKDFIDKTIVAHNKKI